MKRESASIRSIVYRNIKEHDRRELGSPLSVVSLSFHHFSISDVRLCTSLETSVSSSPLLPAGVFRNHLFLPPLLGGASTTSRFLRRAPLALARICRLELSFAKGREYLPASTNMAKSTLSG